MVLLVVLFQDATPFKEPNLLSFMLRELVEPLLKLEVALLWLLVELWVETVLCLLPALAYQWSKRRTL